jgi:hypothetical protein
MMETGTAVLIAYLLAGAHYVWRDSRAHVMDRPAYSRARGIGPKLMAVATWLPVSIVMPWMIGWRWRGLSRYVFSLALFALLAVAGIWIGG